MKRPTSGSILALTTSLYALLWLVVLLAQVIMKMSIDTVLSIFGTGLGRPILALALSVPLLVVALFYGIALAATWGTWRGGTLGRAALAFGLILDIVTIVMTFLTYSLSIQELQGLKPFFTSDVVIGLSIFCIFRLIHFAVAFRSPFYPKAVD